jgi:hypothetical protein
MDNTKKAQIIAAVVFFIVSPIIFILTSFTYNAFAIEQTIILIVLQTILAAAAGLFAAALSVIAVRSSHKSK